MLPDAIITVLVTCGLITCLCKCVDCNKDKTTIFPESSPVTKVTQAPSY